MSTEEISNCRDGRYRMTAQQHMRRLDWFQLHVRTHRADLLRAPFTDQAIAQRLEIERGHLHPCQTRAYIDAQNLLKPQREGLRAHLIDRCIDFIDEKLRRAGSDQKMFHQKQGRAQAKQRRA